jgi:hypothetical protein
MDGMKDLAARAHHGPPNIPMNDTTKVLMKEVLQ